MNRPDAESSVAPLRLLFVCSGNTCRSPLAEVLSRRVASELVLPTVEIRSAGTLTRSGLPASGGALRAAGRHQLSLEGHASRVLSKELVDWADWIFAMGPGHLHQLKMLGASEKAVLLGAFASGNGPTGKDIDENDMAVPDPFGGDDAVYEETFRTLESYVESAMKRLVREVEG